MSTSEYLSTCGVRWVHRKPSVLSVPQHVQRGWVRSVHAYLPGVPGVPAAIRYIMFSHNPYNDQNHYIEGVPWNLHKPPFNFPPPLETLSEDGPGKTHKLAKYLSVRVCTRDLGRAHALARARTQARRHWHDRHVRSGPEVATFALGLEAAAPELHGRRADAFRPALPEARRPPGRVRPAALRRSPNP